MNFEARLSELETATQTGDDFGSGHHQLGRVGEVGATARLAVAFSEFRSKNTSQQFP